MYRENFFEKKSNLYKNAVPLSYFLSFLMITKGYYLFGGVLQVSFRCPEVSQLVVRAGSAQVLFSEKKEQKIAPYIYEAT